SPWPVLHLLSPTDLATTKFTIFPTFSIPRPPPASGRPPASLGFLRCSLASSPPVIDPDTSILILGS
uniref:Uncharacterized protein n=1 Tax=Aegilops tauschii subsp. strangulata TaxID=200361 RepID=A0A453RHU0_AEGTS